MCDGLYSSDRRAVPVQFGAMSCGHPGLVGHSMSADTSWSTGHGQLVEVQGNVWGHETFPAPR